MAPRREKTAYELMTSARDDLTMVHQLLAATRPVAWGIAYHAQQACEKALKAVVWLHGEQEVPRTHDVGALTTLALRLGLEPPLAGELPDLTEYAVTPRYGGPPRPSPEDVADAVRAAEAVVAWAEPLVAEKLSGTEYEEQ